MISPRVVSLTERQKDVLVELCRDGATNRQIARRLKISEDTVKCHLKEIIRAFGVRDRTGVVCAVLRREAVPQIGQAARPPRQPKPINHGTWSGFITHHRREIPVCDPCQGAADRQVELLRAARRRRAAA